MCRCCWPTHFLIVFCGHEVFSFICVLIFCLLSSFSLFLLENSYSNGAKAKSVAEFGVLPELVADFVVLFFWFFSYNIHMDTFCPPSKSVCLVCPTIDIRKGGRPFLGLSTAGASFARSKIKARAVKDRPYVRTSGVAVRRRIHGKQQLWLIKDSLRKASENF